jgi:hypothetical protein
MTYNPNNDQNEKIWPWWVAYEALARFKNNDADGGLFLLHSCAATIRNPQYPGMMDETMSRDGPDRGRARLCHRRRIFAHQYLPRSVWNRNSCRRHARGEGCAQPAFYLAECFTPPADPGWFIRHRGARSCASHYRKRFPH